MKKVILFRPKQKFAFYYHLKILKFRFNNIYCYYIFNKPNLNIKYGNKNGKVNIMKYDTFNLKIRRGKNIFYCYLGRIY